MKNNKDNIRFSNMTLKPIGNKIMKRKVGLSRQNFLML